jgi:hypothetical protein
MSERISNWLSSLECLLSWEDLADLLPGAPSPWLALSNHLGLNKKSVTFTEESS